MIVAHTVAVDYSTLATGLFYFFKALQYFYLHAQILLSHRYYLQMFKGNL